MGRTRNFTDKELSEKWKECKGIVKEVAKVMGVTQASIYQHAVRVGLKPTRASLSDSLNPQPGDRDILRSFTHLLTLKQLGRMNKLSPYGMKKRLMLAVKRLWVNVDDNYTEFPKPESPSDVRVFNFIYSIPPDQFVDESPAREDITYILQYCRIREDLVVDYHNRYLDHIGEIEKEYNEGKRRRPSRKTAIGQRMQGTYEHPRYKKKKKKKKFAPKRAKRVSRKAPTKPKKTKSSKHRQ